MRTFFRARWLPTITAVGAVLIALLGITVTTASAHSSTRSTAGLVTFVLADSSSAPDSVYFYIYPPQSPHHGFYSYVIQPGHSEIITLPVSSTGEVLDLHDDRTRSYVTTTSVTASQENGTVYVTAQYANGTWSLAHP